MNVIPEMNKCCLWYSLKSGSIVVAFLLLVGSAVQMGYYAFLVDHMFPVKICTYTRVDYSYVYELTYADPSFQFLFRDYNLQPYDQLGERENSTRGPAPEDVTDMTRTTSATTNTTAVLPAGTRQQEDGGSTARPAERPTSTHGYRHPYRVARSLPTESTFTAPCQRPERMPFDVDVNFLDFDTRGPFDRAILYFNTAVFGTMMFLTLFLMYAICKESHRLVTAWLATEAVLLSAGTAGTVAAATMMVGALPISACIVTVLNMALHLAIDIYFLIIVFNLRRQLKTKEEDDQTQIEV